MLKITLNLFGQLKEILQTAELVFELPEGSNIVALREKLAAQLQAQQTESIISSVAFATSERILTEDVQFTDNMQIAALPPVCGG